MWTSEVRLEPCAYRCLSRSTRVGLPPPKGAIQPKIYRKSFHTSGQLQLSDINVGWKLRVRQVS